MAYRFRILILSILVGCALGILFPAGLIWILIVSGVMMCMALWMRTRFGRQLVLIPLGVIAGFWWSAIVIAGPSNAPIPPEAPISITGVVDKETVLSGGIRRLQLRVRSSSLNDRPEVVEVATRRGSQPIGTVLRVRCAWKVAEHSAAGNAWECFAQEITAVGFVRPSRVVEWGSQIRQQIIRSVQQAFPEPEGSLLLGMVFGIASGIPRSITDDFRATGTTHLLVFSGMQFVMLIALLERMLVALCIPLWLRSFLIAIAVLLLLVVVGTSPSTIRAAIMAILPLASRLFGRGRARLHILLIAGGGMVLFSPELLGQVGFQLTMLATTGIIVAAPGIAAFLIDHKVYRLVAESIAVTVSATVFTAPIIAVTFGGGGVWVILPNLLLETISQLILIAGVIFILFAWMVPIFAQWYAVVPSALVWIAVGIVHWFAGIFSIPLFNSTTAVVLSYIGAIMFVIWYVRNSASMAAAHAA